MDYRNHIARAIEYIEANLKAELPLGEVALAAGYSEYHFVRVFRLVIGLTPADYIRKRRLSEIVREMMEQPRAVSDIAFEYGFNSKENFSRAFKTEHNILPTEFKQTRNSLRLFDPFQLDVTPFKLEPKIETLASFNLTVLPNTEKTPPMFWNIYNCKKLSIKLSDGTAVADYGVGHWNIEKNQLDYFIGIPSNQAKGDTIGTLQLNIPGGLYAIFTTPPSSHFNFINIIHKSWQYITETWLPKSGYTHANTYDFETYVESSCTFSEKIYIPLKN
ncbi:MAG: AraC family transcriptional regulator [Defluviitaleaceae bacterium]|nr:AraC family transcriptional regulator [Defluviitaleaceae bacterium]